MTNQSDEPTKFTPDGDLPDWADTDINSMANVTPAVLADARADAIRSDAELAAMLEARANSPV